MDFEQAATYMGGLLRLGIKLGNDRFEALLDRLGSPHKKLKVIHFAGTKGKGSTATFAASILRCAGCRVGLYMSPYVYDLRERIQVNGEMIPRDDFARLVTMIVPHIEAIAQTDLGQTTEFELKTAVGLCYMVEQSVDYAVIEVGLGGRLDATNVIPKSLVSVITNIGFDHRELLGDTLGLIAAEKAGILKPGGICVTGINDSEALAAVERIAAERRVTIHRVIEGRDWQSLPDGTVTIESPNFTITHATLGLGGRFQHANAALAIHALNYAGVNVRAEALRRGLATAYAPGRLEVVRAENPTVVLDVAHNEIAGHALRRALIENFDAANRPLFLVVGMSKGHDPAELIGALLAQRDGGRLRPALFVATQPARRPRSAAEVASAARASGCERVEIIESVADSAHQAITAAAALANGLVVITGSFYTVGELPPDVLPRVPG